jgi:hypothetical protein
MPPAMRDVMNVGGADDEDAMVTTTTIVYLQYEGNER